MTCPECNGSGFITVIRHGQEEQTTCDVCCGEGFLEEFDPNGEFDPDQENDQN